MLKCKQETKKVSRRDEATGDKVSIANNRVRDYTKHAPYTKLANGLWAHQVPEYKSWDNMLQRCYTPSSISYGNYGGRGIRVCDRWMKFLNFYDDMGSKPSLNHSLDRINNNGNYEPSNCRWATKGEQVLNRRLSKRNNSGYRGVFWDKQLSKWHAQVYSIEQNRNISVGYFDSVTEAALAYDCAAVQVQDRDARPNLIYF